MRYSPIFLVTEYLEAKRKSPASRYSENAAMMDVWKVGMIHGYYAGMGMDLFFPNDGEASRFSLWTLWNPQELIAALDNRRFQVQSITKTKRMSARGEYSGQRRLVDSWKVSFGGDHDDYLDMQHPTEGSAKAFRFGKSYTPADLFGTLPAIPRDVSFLLEEIAARNREEPETPPTPPEPPEEPPPGPPVPPPGPSLAERQRDAIFRWYTIAPGQAASAWYAEGNPQAIQADRFTYNQVTNPYVKGPYIYFPQGGTLSGFFFPENRDGNNTFFGCVVLA